MEQAADPQLLANPLHKLRLHQAALVVALLVPGVRKEKLHPLQGAIGDTLVDHLIGIVMIDADILDTFLAHAFQQRPHPRQVHLNPDKILLGLEFGHLQQGAAHAKADFQDQWRFAAKNLGKIRRTLFHGQALVRPMVVIGFLLARGHAPATNHEAADATKMLLIAVRHREIS